MERDYEEIVLNNPLYTCPAVESYKYGRLFDEKNFPFRMFCCAPSGGGKTSMVMTMLASEDEFFSFDYDIVMWVAPVPPTMVEKYDFGDNNFCFLNHENFYSNYSLAKLEQAYNDQELHRVFCFDDVPAEAAILNNILEYFRTARHFGASCIICSQTPKDPFFQIRDQCNIVAINTRRSRPLQIKTLLDCSSLQAKNCKQKFYYCFLNKAHDNFKIFGVNNANDCNTYDF